MRGVKNREDTYFKCPNGCSDEDHPHGNQQLIGTKRNGEVYWLWCNVCGEEPVPMTDEENKEHFATILDAIADKIEEQNEAPETAV